MYGDEKLLRLPLYDGFFLDTRKKRERKVMNPTWLPRNSNHPLRIEIADKNDLSLVANFVNYHFIENSIIRKAIDATFEEMKQFSFERVAKALEKPNTWVVFDENKLVAAVLQTYYTPDEFNNLFNGDLFHLNPKLSIKDDYAKDIKNGPYKNLNANRIFVLSNECFKQIGKFLPKDVKNLAYGAAIGVHQTFMRSGLGEYLMYENIKDWKNFNCNYSVCICTALASYEASKKLGMKELFCFSYKEFKENGKPIFGNISNGALGCHVMLVNVKEFIHIFAKQAEKRKSKI